MFIRTKKVKKRDYAYLVKNVWTKKGPRQKTIKYLGLVIELSEVNPRNSINTNGSVKEIYIELMKRELIVRGFEFLDNVFKFNDITVNLDKPFVRKKSRNVVLKMNEGFLCAETIKILYNHTMQEDFTGKRFAEDILEAGINIEKDVFVQLYEKLKH